MEGIKKYALFAGLLGILLIVVGGVSYAVIGMMTTPVAVLIWVGIILSLLFLYVNFPEIRAQLTGRSAKYGANVAVMVGVFMAILSMTAMMSVKYKARWDLTSSARYTLSKQTLKIIKSLDKDVEAISFYRSDERTRQMMEDLLDLYAVNSPNFTYWFVDPDKKPGMAEKYGVTSYRTTLIRSGGNQEVVGHELEEKLTNAILKVTRDEVKTVYFIKGHGEKSITDDGKGGYKAAGGSIAKQNFRTKELLLTEVDTVPDDCSVLILSGPQKDLLDEELEKISAYVDKGGSLLVMLDPGATPALAGYLTGYGFLVGDNIIIDTQAQVFGANYLVPVVNEYEKDHPLTEGFNLMTFFPLARSVTVQPTPEAGIYNLAKTGAGAWGETDKGTLEEGKARFDENIDKKGPLTIAAVVTMEAAKEEGDEEEEVEQAPEPVETPEVVTEGGRAPKKTERKRYARIVVIGDSDFANNTHINLAGNRDFFLNTVSWLAEEADMISIRKKEVGMTPLILTSTQGRFILWVSVVIPASIVAVIGVGVFMRRRLGE